jgi:MoxR-like ATPase
VNVDELRQRFERIHAEITRVVIGQDELVSQTLIALLGRGHVLIEGAPGLGKTLLVRVLGEVLGCAFKRIQFTPDLMPSDVTGGNIFNQKLDAFEFVAGPVFTQLLLADEINRAPAKTQSALLEAMQEHTISVDGTTRSLPRPFFVIATQNPLESQGTYPLPEAQLDRFLFKLFVRHPSAEMEKAILMNHQAGFDAVALERSRLQRLATPADLLAMTEASAGVRVAEPLLDYIIEIVGRTRTHRFLTYGASPRASIALLNVSRVHAVVRGRDFVVPDDIKELAAPVLRHRVGLHPDAEIEGVTTDDCVSDVLRETPVPKGLE